MLLWGKPQCMIKETISADIIKGKHISEPKTAETDWRMYLFSLEAGKIKSLPETGPSEFLRTLALIYQRTSKGLIGPVPWPTVRESHSIRMLLQLHMWHYNPHGALATDAAARALSSALPIWEEEIFKRGKKEKRTAFFISLTAHYHGNSPGLAWLAGPPLPITGENNTIRKERGGEMREQYCIQSIILQLNVFSFTTGRSVLGGQQ